MLDVRQAEVARGQAEVALIQARQNVTVEKLRLFQTIGVPAPDDPTVVVLTDTFPVVAPQWRLEDLLTEADAANPDLTSLRASASAAQASARVARSTWLPTLSFSAGWSGYTQQFTDSDVLVDGARLNALGAIAQCEYANAKWVNPGAGLEDCSTFAVTPDQEADIRARNTGFPFAFERQPFSAYLGISLPLFTQFNRPLQVAEAGAAAQDAREAVRARELQVRTDVSQAYYTLVTAHETIGIQENNRTAAAEQLRLATERYRVGSGTFFELLDAQVAAQRAEADYVNAVYLYHQAIAALEAAVGRPLR
jgi:outer membrane protein